MSDDRETGWRWWVRYVVIPIVVASVPSVFAIMLAKEWYQRTLLPIAANPSTSISGTWTIEYWDLFELTPTPQKSGRLDPIFEENQAPPTLKATTAQIEISEKGSFFYGTAMSDGRTWKIEGYLDGDSILYVYKDTTNPNSFGSAFLRRDSMTSGFLGTWSGASPEFTRADGSRSPRPFLVSGRVRWSKPLN